MSRLANLASTAGYAFGGPPGPGGGGGGSGSGAFTSTAGLRTWIRSDNTLNTTNTVKDMSANNYPWTINGSPSLVTVNGKGDYLLDTVAKNISCPSFASLYNNPTNRHMFAVFTVNSVPSNTHGPFVHLSSADGNNWDQIGAWDNGKAYVLRGDSVNGSAYAESSPLVFGTKYLFESILRSSGYILYNVNGIGAISPSIYGFTMNLTNCQMLGAVPVNFSEFAIVDRELTGVELSTARSAMSSYWGLGF